MAKIKIRYGNPQVIEEDRTCSVRDQHLQRWKRRLEVELEDYDVTIREEKGIIAGREHIKSLRIESGIEDLPAAAFLEMKQKVVSAAGFMLNTAGPGSFTATIPLDKVSDFPRPGATQSKKPKPVIRVPARKSDAPAPPAEKDNSNPTQQTTATMVTKTNPEQARLDTLAYLRSKGYGHKDFVSVTLSAKKDMIVINCRSTNVQSKMLRDLESDGMRDHATTNEGAKNIKVFPTFRNPLQPDGTGTPKPPKKKAKAKKPAAPKVKTPKKTKLATLVDVHAAIGKLLSNDGNDIEKRVDLFFRKFSSGDKNTVYILKSNGKDPVTSLTRKEMMSMFL